MQYHSLINGIHVTSYYQDKQSTSTKQGKQTNLLILICEFHLQFSTLTTGLWTYCYNLSRITIMLLDNVFAAIRSASSGNNKFTISDNNARHRSISEKIHFLFQFQTPLAAAKSLILAAGERCFCNVIKTTCMGGLAASNSIHPCQAESKKSAFLATSGITHH